MVKSAAYPTLERKPGGPDNWVEAAGGLPSYIERIAKHLHYEQGMSISRAIAVAVNTVKRWARKGGVVKYGDPNNKHVTTITAAQAAKAVAEWEAKKAMAKAKVNLSSDLVAMAERANSITDPKLRAEARARVIDLAVGTRKPPYQFRHGFIPRSDKAVKSKAKGSPVAERRIRLLYSNPTGQGGPDRVPSGPRSVANRPGWEKKNRTAPPKLLLTRPGGDLNVKRAASAVGIEKSDYKPNTRVKLKNMDKARGGGRTKYSEKNWDEIADNLKTVRNGKKYVIANFDGKQQLVEWTGKNPSDWAPKNAGARLMLQVDPAKIAAMTDAEIRAMIAVPGQPKSVVQALNKALRSRSASTANRG